MQKTFLTIFIGLLITSFANAQTRQSPYVGQESNKIKSLSASEIQSYLNGEGMGLAKAAELNSYPGPKHVLELADKLGLSQAQKNQTQKSFDRMKRSAIRIGKMIVNSEAQLSELFASAQMDDRKLQLLTQRIGRYEGELRRTHLKAHLEMKRILSPAQIKKYDELRGYRKDVKSGEHKHLDNLHLSLAAVDGDSRRKEMFLGLRTAIYYTPDLERAKEWYTKALGIEPYFAEPFYVGFNVGGFELGLQPDKEAGLEGLGGSVAYWGVESADEAFDRLIGLGATALSAVQEVGGGIKVAIVRDPFGNALGIIENPHFKLST